jgi:prefoldin subunit 5
MSEPEIIREMRTEGYTPMEVDGAMKQALRRGAVDAPQAGPPSGAQQYGAPAPEPSMPPPQSPELSALPPPPTEADRRRIFAEGAPPPPMPGQDQPRPPFKAEEMQRLERSNQLGLPELPGLGGAGGADMPPPEDTVLDEDFSVPGMDRPSQPNRIPTQRPRSRVEGKRQLEEMAEAIVEEKAELFRNEVDQVSEELRKLQTKIRVVEERFDQIDRKKKSELDEIKTSLSGYKESITDVSARMESVERAMKDSMSPMLQTLRSLSEAVKELKKK